MSHMKCFEILMVSDFRNHKYKYEYFIQIFHYSLQRVVSTLLVIHGAFVPQKDHFRHGKQLYLAGCQECVHGWWTVLHICDFCFAYSHVLLFLSNKRKFEQLFSPKKNCTRGVFMFHFYTWQCTMSIWGISFAHPAQPLECYHCLCSILYPWPWKSQQHFQHLHL